VSNLHFIASIPNSVLLEFDQNPNGLRTELLTQPVEPDGNAVVHLGDSPGLGTGFDRDTLSRYASAPPRTSEAK
jgi:L-alanine-DL-glutamate epimerase-like enolase superfamily enzyme